MLEAGAQGIVPARTMVTSRCAHYDTDAQEAEHVATWTRREARREAVAPYGRARAHNAQSR